MKIPFFSLLKIALVAAIGSMSVGQVYAQDTNTKSFDESTVQLESIQALINANVEVRAELRTKITNAAADELPELQKELELLNTELDKQQFTFEQVAIGAIDVAVLGDIDTAFDWRNEMSQIMQPIVANLKALTDKPRKISKLQTLIEKNRNQIDVIDTALVSIDNNMSETNEATTRQSLSELQKAWQARKIDNRQSLSVARKQLAELQNPDTNVVETVSEAISAFFKGRGLTLLMAFVAAVIVWFFMRGVLRLSKLKTKTTDRNDYRTRTRVAQYGFRALTFLLILIVVISVFHVRGDLLLMGLSILAAAGLALGLRQALPRYVTEAKLLLNLGSIRENERVMYAGLPWQVVSLNMYSILRNPDLTGVLRLPLSEIHSLVSRPAGKEPWFPASKGDFILLDSAELCEVTRLTPETVEMIDKGGTITSVPSTDFYAWTFKNLSRGDFFGISATFGVDYQHQANCLTDIPVRFQQAVTDALNQTVFAESVKEVLVEFQSAGESSLDYWIYVTLDNNAAKARNKIDRLIQHTLVDVCTCEGWGIPFPHMTINKLADTA